ncbi:hypothetical protein [Wolbachia endosymbiont of Dactylopius coccus]|nr:MAG: hypothetical protein TV42_00610 [Wolbachia endosymbiont of Dactylopius coccus]
MSDPISAALSILAGIGGLTGCTVGLVCYALSVPLSPLIIGSITTVVSAILASASFILVAFMLGGQSSNPKRDSIVLFSQLFFPQVVIGIGLSAAIKAVPGITLDINSAANLGVIIGFATPILGILAMVYAPRIAEKVNHYIIEPVIEKVKECFSSKEA